MAVLVFLKKVNVTLQLATDLTVAKNADEETKHFHFVVVMNCVRLSAGSNVVSCQNLNDNHEVFIYKAQNLVCRD